MEIPRDVADAEGVPEDLDSGAPGPYTFPSPRRRVRAGLTYLIAALFAVLAALGGLHDGFWVVAAGFVAIAGIHALAGWDLKVADGQALETANRAVEFGVGHASATVGFTGWLARPVWNVLVFSADEPPTQRGLVRVDGITGDVIETYAEAIPEGEV